jgi:hypothetical protein
MPPWKILHACKSFNLKDMLMYSKARLGGLFEKLRVKNDEIDYLH